MRPDTAPGTRTLMRWWLAAAVQPIFVCGAAEYRVEPLAPLTPRFPAYGIVDDLVIFEAFDGSLSNLYSTDGNSVKLLPVAGVEKLRPGRLAGKSGPFKGELYFVADGRAGRTLYKTDGRAVTEVASGVSGILQEDIFLPPVGNATDHYLYFERDTVEGRLLYKTDGSAVMSAQIDPRDQTRTRFAFHFEGDAILHLSGPDGGRFYREGASGLMEIAYDGPITGPSYRVPFQGDLIFTARDNDGWGLFRTDGTSIRKIDFADEIQSIDSLFVADDRLYFKATVSSLPYKRVWHTDGSTVELLDLAWEDQGQARFIGGTEGGLYLFEHAERRILRTDGLSFAEVSVDLRPDVFNVSLKAVVGDTLVLDLQAAETGVAFSLIRGLFLLNGDTATFVDINDGAGYTPSNVTAFGEDVFFTAAGANGVELFKVSDGGEVTEFDINPSGSSSPQSISIIDGTMYFSALGPMGRELYATDGASLAVIDINPNGDSNPVILRHFDGTLLVVADAGRGRELFSVTRALVSGDYDGNGRVDQGDLDLVLLNWGTGGVPIGWMGNPPSGMIDQEELDRVLLGWGNESLGGPAAVPEPGTAALLAAMLLLMMPQLAIRCISAGGMATRQFKLDLVRGGLVGKGGGVAAFYRMF